MTDEEFMREMKEDMRQEWLQEMYEEQRIHRDEEYAYEKLGIDDIYQAIYDLSLNMQEYGYDSSVYEILDRLREY